ncbi:hypothetical protein D3C71_1874800 [compost metagenome]
MPGFPLLNKAIEPLLCVSTVNTGFVFAVLKLTNLAALPLLKLGVQANSAFPVPSAVVSTPSPEFVAFAVMPLPLPSAIAITAGPLPAGLD